MTGSKIISAVRNQLEFEVAVKSKVDTVFMLSTNIEVVGEQIAVAHQKGKKVFVHVDLADGIGKDIYGIRYLKNLNVDGIISTRTNIIKIAKKLGDVSQVVGIDYDDDDDEQGSLTFVEDEENN